MIAYIKDRYSFKTKTTVNLEKFNVILESVNSESSSFDLLPDQVVRDNKSDWICLSANSFWLIDSVEPSDKSTKLKCLSPIDMFDREVLYSASTSTIEEFIESIIEDQFINQGDPEYQYSYLEVTSTGSTVFVAPETDDFGIFNFAEYLRTVDWVYGVVLHFSIDANTLKIDIRPRSLQSHNIYFNDGKSSLTSQTFTDTGTAKITTIVQNAGSSTIHQWFLATDGSIYMDSPPGNRAKGAWRILTFTNADEDVQARVQEEFSGQFQSYRIEFNSSENLSVGQYVYFRLNGSIFRGEITYKALASGNSRFVYHSGELAVTLVDKMKNLSK